jgi:ABC-2 type transport system permease protein
MNTWLLLSLVLLVATGFKRSGTAVAVGIVGYFLLSLVNVPMIALIKKYAWLKWNPINMFNYASQLRVASLSHVTKLSNMQFFWGNLVYIGLFLALGWLLFRRREV